MSSSKPTRHGSQSSKWRAHAPSMRTALNASAPSFAPALSQAQVLETLSESGPVRVCITSERETTSAFPDRPGFLKGVRFDPLNSRVWYENVLPYLSTCTFIFASTADVTYGGSILSSAALPHIYNAVTKVELPKFYWSGGVARERQNPYLQMCRNLPNLRELSLTMHTAGLTNQRWAERQIIALERNNPDAAKERIVLSVQEVVHRYALDALFACSGLQSLRVEYIESAMTAYFCKVGNPVKVLRDTKAYLEQGFVQRDLPVAVQLVASKEEA